MSKYVSVASCYKEKSESKHRFMKNVRTHISAKASTALLAGAVASQALHALRRTQRPWQMKSSIQHPQCDERNRGVILTGREVRGFLDSGMAGIYEVKKKPCHAVKHLSTTAPDAFLTRSTGYRTKMVSIMFE